MNPSTSQRPSPTPQRHLTLLAGGLALLITGGCAEAPLPGQQLRSDDCLRGFSLERLPDQLKRCDQVVAAFPAQPGPRNDRYLLRSLAGDEAGACQDIQAARRLLQQPSSAPRNNQLAGDLDRRQALCSAPRRAPGPTSPASTGAP